MSKNYVCNNRKCRYHDTTMIMHCARSISAEDDRPYALACRAYNAIRERPILFSGAMVRAILEGRKTMTRRVVKPQPHAGVDAVKWQDVIITGCNTPDQSGFAMMRGGVIDSEAIRCPYGMPGDRLWVRETFRVESVGTHVPVKIPYEDVGIVYAADGEKRNIHREYPSVLSSTCHNNKPSIFMPRWASRITLEITGVRVERLQEITEADAIAEGVEPRTREKGYTIVCRGGGTFEVSSLYERGVPAVGDASPFGEVTHVEPIPERVLISTSGVFRLLWMKINGRSSWDANPWVWVVEFRRVEK